MPTHIRSQVLNLLSGLVSGVGLIILWAVLTKPKSHVLESSSLIAADGDKVWQLVQTDWVRIG